MTPIFVWAVITGDEGILLVPAQNADGWLLPGGPLRDDDDTVEAAMARELEARFGVRLVEEPAFLDTQYERMSDGRTVVHNLFHVPSDLLGDGLAAADGTVQWLDPDAAGDAALPNWLRHGLASLFTDDSAAPALDLAEIRAAVGMPMHRPPVLIISGPSGAGKSTVARELCRRFPRAAHIDVDLLRWRMVVSGYVRPEDAYGPEPDEARRQLALAARNACALAINFVDEGFLAVIDDVLETPAGLDSYLDALGPSADVRAITLLPSALELARRDGERHESDRMGARSEELRPIIAANGESRGIRLDTSDWSVEHTVDIIVERLDEARVTVARENDL